MRKNKSGFNRNDAEGKVRFDLIPTFMLERLGTLYAKGASKFGVNNWKKANAMEDYDSFKESAFRHFIQYVDGAEDKGNSASQDDHFAACIWNLVGMEYVDKQLNKKK